MKTSQLTPGLVLIVLLGSAAPGQAQDSGKPVQKIPVRNDPPVNPDDFVVSTDQLIQGYKAKIQKDPRDVSSHVLLAHALMVKARETGDARFYDTAEAPVRAALELIPTLAAARLQRCTLLSVRHEFAAALELAKKVYAQNPLEHHCLVVISDCCLELGKYTEAERALDDVERLDPAIVVQSRRARLAELRGRTKEALALMQQALSDEAYSHVSPKSRAWYHARLAEMAFNQGQFKEARGHYEQALKISPQYVVALAGLGRICAAQSRDQEAIELLTKAVSTCAELQTLADLGDLHARGGKEFLANLNFDRVQQYGAKQAAYARELSLFYSNHDRNLKEALELARADLRSRQDVGAHDTLAWALFKNGNCEEAQKEIKAALALGTQDASFFYHAGMICAGLGQKTEARDWLGRALHLNPGFSITQAGVARKTLEQVSEGKN